MIRFRSLTIRLLVALVAPLVVSAVLIGAGGAWVIKSVVDYTSDRLLAGSVRAIAESSMLKDGKLWVDIPPWSLALLDSPQRDSVYYSVRFSGRLITGYGDLPDFPAGDGQDVPAFRTITYAGQPIRQAVQVHKLPGASAPVIISVAQTLDSRLAVRKQLMASAGLMELALVALVALLVWPAATWSLRPLGGLLRDLSDRANSKDLDFTPVPAGGVPSELQPVVVAFNSLLAQLERSVEGVRRFTADASHQMRTPLAILKTHLTLLGRSKRSAADGASLTDAVEAVDRLQRLIEQLLGLARADAVDEHGLEISELRDLVRRTADRWRPRFLTKGATLKLDAPAGGATVAFSEPLLEQMLENLLDNALRYGGEAVTITLRIANQSALLDVSDNGNGPPPAILERPFERFVRGSRSGPEGSGLGLSIVYALAIRGGGTVEMLSLPDLGFTVRVSLPMAA